MRAFNKLAFLSIDTETKLSDEVFTRWGYFLISSAIYELLVEKKIKVVSNLIYIIDREGIDKEISKYAARIPTDYTKRRQKALLIYPIIDRYNSEINFRNNINNHLLQINKLINTSHLKEPRIIQKIKHTVKTPYAEVKTAHTLVVNKFE